MIETKQLRLCVNCGKQMRFFRGDWYNWHECEDCGIYLRDTL